MNYNVRHGAIRWQISKSIKVVWHIFALALTVNELLNCEYWKEGHET